MIVPSFTLPLHILALLALGWFVTIILVWYLMDLRHYGREGFDMRKCRKKNIPYIIDVDVGSGKSEGYPAEKKKKGAGRILHKSEAGAKIDPGISMGQDEPLHFPRGLDIQIYGTLDAWPTSLKTAAGIHKIKEIRRKPEYAVFDPIPDKDLIELLNMPDEHLPHDVRIFIERYKIQNPDVTTEEIKEINDRMNVIAKDPAFRDINWMRRDDLFHLFQADEADLPVLISQTIDKYNVSNEPVPPEVPVAVKARVDEIKQSDHFFAEIKSPEIDPIRFLELVNKLKDEAAKTAIDPRFTAYRSALKDNPNAYKTTDVSTLENILRQMFIEDLLSKLNWMQYGIIIMGIIGVSAVAATIVWSIIGKG